MTIFAPESVFTCTYLKIDLYFHENSLSFKGYGADIKFHFNRPAGFGEDF